LPNESTKVEARSRILMINKSIWNKERET
jgi:hypothetical protein